MNSKILNQLLDYLYPPACHHCDTPTQDGRYLCANCAAESRRLTPPFCIHCSEAFNGAISEDLLCPNCHQLDFDFLFARSALHNTRSNHQLLVDFKYLKKFYLSTEIARFCAEVMKQDQRFSTLENPVFIPVPLHWQRKWHRGFNQAEELSKELTRLTQIPSHRALNRLRNTRTQTRLGRNDRLKNLKDAFKFTHLPKHFKSAILLDDVFTTGSTATACARELKKHAPWLENIVVLTALRS